MEKVEIIGNVCKAPQKFSSQAGNEYVSFPVAVNKVVKGDKVTDFFDVVVFGKTAEACMKYVTKGMKLFASGELGIRFYTNKDGQQKASLSISNAVVEFLSKGEEKASEKQENGAWEELKSEDIPF